MLFVSSAFSLSVDSGVRVFIVDCGPIGALQAVMVVLQVVTIETIMSEIEIRFAGSEGLEGMKLENIKPEKIVSSSPLVAV